MVADFRVQTKNNDKSVTRHFLARNGQCGWQFLKYFVSNQLGKTNTKLSTSVQDLNVCTLMKSGILNHYTIVNIYCYIPSYISSKKRNFCNRKLFQVLVPLLHTLNYSARYSENDRN